MGRGTYVAKESDGGSFSYSGINKLVDLVRCCRHHQRGDQPQPKVLKLRRIDTTQPVKRIRVLMRICGPLIRICYNSFNCGICW